MRVQISTLGDTGDPRGFSFSLPPDALEFVGGIADILFASTRPGAVRGNHYHVHKRQALVLFPGSAWSLYWDEGAGTAAQQRNFDGSSAILVLVSPGCSQAIRNDGTQPLWLVACSSKPYDANEIAARKVI
jgi:oxalate decarboxylase/phosphoglucose isomerase-like protein (cupin superfamily)